MGKKVTAFEGSTRFESVTFYMAGASGAARVVLRPSAVPSLQVPSQVGRIVELPSLEKYGVVLVQLAPHAGPDALGPVVDAYNRLHGGSPHRAVVGRSVEGNPIYASGAVDSLVINEVIIQFKAGTEPRAVIELFRLLKGEILRRPRDIGAEPYLVRFPGESGHEAGDMSNRLDAMQQVVFAQPNFIGIDHKRLPAGGLAGVEGACMLKCPDPVSPVLTGDPFFVKQWHLQNTGAIGTEFADINATNAWAITQGRPQVVVAVLDDWIETSHEELVGKSLPAWNAFEADGSASAVEFADSDRHGTAAAGLVAAKVGNLRGIAGVAPKVRILPVRTHDPTFPHDVVALGIRRAAERAEILSMSWTLGEGGLDEPVIDQAVEFASVQMRRILVFAAGNEQGQDVAYPASLATRFPVIAVSATDANDALKKITDPTDECSWGTQASEYSVAAPGVDLYTIDRAGAAGYCASGSNDNYTLFSGTSAATPLVAGAAALLVSVSPDLSPQSVRNRLQQTARHPHPARRPNDVLVPNVASGWGLGWGRIDACTAIEASRGCAR